MSGERPERHGPSVSFVGGLGEERIADLRESIRLRNAEKLGVLDGIAEGPGDPAVAFEAATGSPYEGILGATSLSSMVFTDTIFP